MGLIPNSVLSDVWPQQIFNLLLCAYLENKMTIMPTTMMMPHWAAVQIKWVNIWKGLRTVPGTEEELCRVCYCLLGWTWEKRLKGREGGSSGLRSLNWMLTLASSLSSGQGLGLAGAMGLEEMTGGKVWLWAGPTWPGTRNRKKIVHWEEPHWQREPCLTPAENQGWQWRVGSGRCAQESGSTAATRARGGKRSPLLVWCLSNFSHLGATFEILAL